MEEILKACGPEGIDSVKKRNNPPKILEVFLQALLSPDDRESLLGDFQEMYDQISNKGGVIRARFWYVFHVIKLIPAYVENKIYWSLSMLKNYFKIVLRNIKRHKGYSFINIAGLVTGMACFILMMLYVYHELSFDKFHENKNRIYRIAHQSPGNEYMGSDYYAVGPAPLAAALMEEAPEVDVATKFGFPRSILLGKGDDGFTIRVFYADENFFNVFSFRLIEGDKNTALAEPNCAVVSQDIVNKYFKGENPLGKTIFNIIKVTGVVENVPENSHIQFDCVISFVNLFSLEKREEALQNWKNSSYFTYVKLREGCDYQQFSKKILSIVDKHYEYDRERNYFLQPLESIHLKSHINFEFSQNNDIKLIYLFMSIAFLILIIACINYMNLSTARASNRAKEIGVKKVIGAKRGQLFKQFTAESILITLVSLVLALGIVCLLLPSFSSFVERDINIDNLLDWRFLTGLAAVILITGLSAGLYPALFLSSFHPVNIIKGTTSRRSGKEWVRSALVVFQFCTTTILLSFGLIVYKQINFIRSENIGYDRENIVVLRLIDGGVRKNLEAFKNEIKNDSRVLGMTASSGLPTTIESGSNGIYENEAGEEIRFHTHVFAADYDFLDVYRMEIVKGRDFSRKSGTDEENAVIVNETFVKKANWKIRSVKKS